MVTAYGLNGDMGYSMTNEQKYGGYTLTTHYFRCIVRSDLEDDLKHSLWLRIMGLMETWNMKI